MSHLIESYSKILKSKIGKPYIYTKYYPLPFENYITVQSSSPMPAKKYPYLQDVIDFIKPELDKLNIKIVQLGEGGDSVLRGIFNLCGQTTISQSAYIVSKAKMHIGIDSALIHIASCFEIPTVGIYSVSPPQNCGAFWGRSNIAIEPDFKGRTYSFNPGEQPSPSCNIKPEAVLQAVNKTLNLNVRIPKSIFFGHRCQDSVLEFVPTHFLHPEFEKDKVINIRLDYAFQINSFNDQVFLKTIQDRDVTIITDRPINLSILIPFKSKIKTLMYQLDENDNEQFVELLHKSGLNYNLITEQENKLNDFKFKYMDYGIVHLVKRSSYEEREKIFNQDWSKLFYKSNRIILANEKIYISRAALIEDKPLLNSVDIFSQKLSIIENKANFISELEHFYIYG